MTTGATKNAEYDNRNRESRRAGWRASKDKHKERLVNARAIAREEKFRSLEFVAWDGEGSEVDDGEPQPYMLFGNSDGISIQREELRTEECLAAICQGDPNVINFSFAFTYDANQILWELPKNKMYALTQGRRVVWNDFVIEWAAGKWFRVRRNWKGEKWIKIYDSFHFFNESLVKVLKKYNIGTKAEREYLEKMKEARPQFSWAEIEEVKKYWKLEGKLMVQLMEYIRDLFADAGLFLRNWHGAGAVARLMLDQHNIKAAKIDMRKSYPEVWIAARYAFSAGRFEQFVAGLHLGDIWNYDIHSAFPYAIQFLPNLANGKWVHNRTVDRNGIDSRKFALYQIEYHTKRPYNDDRSPRPLFRRLLNDNICWPNRVNGWYWSPEAELVKDDLDAKFIESWEFVGDGSQPLAWIAEIYKKREYLKRIGNVMEYVFKLGMNACYGQFAQRTGWQNTRNDNGERGGPPIYHQLEWAGYVTSMCKAMVYRVAKWAHSHGELITIDTDGVFTTVRVPNDVLPNGIGDDLGQWEETKYSGILIFQNGFYWLRNEDGWKKAKSRGAPRGSVPIERAWETLDQMEMGTVGKRPICHGRKNGCEYRKALCQRHAAFEYSKHIFVSFGKALQGDFLSWRSWQDQPHKLKFGGTGKRQHDGRLCPKCVYYQFGFETPGWESQFHTLVQYDPHPTKEYHEGDDYWSLMHKLPWINRKEERCADLLLDPEELDIFEESTL